MLNLDHPTRMGVPYAPMTETTFKTLSQPLQLHNQRRLALPFFDAHLPYSIALYPKQFCEKLFLHLISPPVRLFRLKRQEINLPNALLSQNSVKSQKK